MDPARTDRDGFRDPHAAAETWLTADIPGTGGVLKSAPEDFVVEEIPAYEPCGQGEHLYLFVEKRNLSTTDLVRIVARHYRVRPGDVGFAGMKDKAAVTRQLVSVYLPGRDARDFPPLEHERCRVLWADRHTNKLKRGHLRGNAFQIRLREAGVAELHRALRTLRTLERMGVPNRAGEQRFGARMQNHRIGRADLRADYAAALDELLGPQPGFENAYDAEARRLYAAGDHAGALAALPASARSERAALRALARAATAEQAFHAVDDTQRRFWVTAFQSAVFNIVLDRRIAEGTFDRVIEGDLAFKHDNGAVFAVDAATAADPATAERAVRLEISPSGPLWGAKMTRAAGAVGDMELDALESAGVTLADMERFAERTGQALAGARRPLRVPMSDVRVEAGADDRGQFLQCAFRLPAGAFATVVMQEVMKPPPRADHAPAADEEESP